VDNIVNVKYVSGGVIMEKISRNKFIKKLKEEAVKVVLETGC